MPRFCTYRLLLVLCLVAIATPLMAADLTTLIERTEPVVIKAKELRSTVGEKRTHLELFAFRNKTLQAIPWQWDAVDEEGWIELTNKTKRTTIARNDDFLWLAGDMGDLAEDAVLLTACPTCSWMQVEMKRDGKPSQWVYLRIGEVKDTPGSLAPYVSYDTPEGLIKTPYYYVGYRDIIIANRFGWINADGSRGRNLIDQVAASFSARLLFGLFPLSISEKDLESKLLGEKSGPVRLTQGFGTRVKLGMGLKGPTNMTQTYFYPNLFRSKVAIHFPRGGKALIKDASFQFNVDLTRGPSPISIHLPPDHFFKVTPDLKPGQYAVIEPSPTWTYLLEESGRRGVVVHVAVPEKEKDVIVVRQFNYVHEPDDKKIGTLHLQIDVHTKPGDHAFDLYLFSPPADTAPDAAAAFATMEAYADLLRSPLHIESVRVLQNP